jgi:hypothetical protein
MSCPHNCDITMLAATFTEFATNLPRRYEKSELPELNHARKRMEMLISDDPQDKAPHAETTSRAKTCWKPLPLHLHGLTLRL